MREDKDLSEGEEQIEKVWDGTAWVTPNSNEEFPLEIPLTETGTDVLWEYRGLTDDKVGPTHEYTITALAIDPVGRENVSQPATFRISVPEGTNLDPITIKKPSVIFFWNNNLVTEIPIGYGQELTPPLCITTIPPGKEGDITGFRTPDGGYIADFSTIPGASCSSGIPVDVKSAKKECIGVGRVQVLVGGSSIGSIVARTDLPTKTNSELDRAGILCKEDDTLRGNCLVADKYILHTVTANEDSTESLDLTNIDAKEILSNVRRVDSIRPRCPFPTNPGTKWTFVARNKDTRGWKLPPDFLTIPGGVNFPCADTTTQEIIVGACPAGKSDLTFEVRTARDVVLEFEAAGKEIDQDEITRGTLRTSRTDCRNPFCAKEPL